MLFSQMALGAAFPSFYLLQKFEIANPQRCSLALTHDA